MGTLFVIRWYYNIMKVQSFHILSLEDTKNIAFKSGTSLSVWALKGIGLSAQKITIKTPSALNMSRNPESQ